MPRQLPLAIFVVTAWTVCAQAKPVALHFDVPAPCSREWAARGGASVGANAFGRECLARSGSHPKMMREAVLSLALELIRSDDRLSSLQPTDVGMFCPNYAQLDISHRQMFWAGLLTAIAQPESGFNPMDAYWEGSNDPEFSIGLLQISPSNKAAYRCEFTSEAELTDPKANLRCGVRIMRRLVDKAGIIGGGSVTTGRAGAAAYWSTLRAVAYKPVTASGRLAADTRSRIVEAASLSPGCR